MPLEGQGAGPIDAFVCGLNHHFVVQGQVFDYHEHAVGNGADAEAVAYLKLFVGDVLTLFGVDMPRISCRLR